MSTSIKKIWFQYLPSFLLGSLIIVYLLPSSQCPSILYFGFPCTFCGGTRAFMSFHQLNWIQSFSYNPLVFIGLLSLWIVGLLGLFSGFNSFFKKIFKKIQAYINNHFFILLSLFIVLYLVQTFYRIIYH